MSRAAKSLPRGAMVVWKDLTDEDPYHCALANSVGGNETDQAKQDKHALESQGFLCSGRDIYCQCSRLFKGRIPGNEYRLAFVGIQRACFNRELLERLRQSGTPVILLDRDVVPFPKRSEFDLVSLDSQGSDWYNTKRGHSARNHLPPVRDEDSPPTIDLETAKIECHTDLGGLLKSYRPAA